MAELQGRVALITGGGRGVGRATAIELARRGAAVAVTARSNHELDETVALIHGIGGTAIAVPTDLAAVRAVDALIPQVEERLGQVGILVNNAAMVGPFGPTWEVDHRVWIDAIQVNLTAPMQLIHAALPNMIAARWGRILNVSSGAAQNPIPRFGAYSTCKAGMDMLTRQVASELDGTGVTVTTIYPGTVDTVMQASIRKQDETLIGTDNVRLFHGFHESGALIPAEHPARLIAAISCMESPPSGRVVSVSSDEGRILLASTALRG